MPGRFAPVYLLGALSGRGGDGVAVFAPPPRDAAGVDGDPGGGAGAAGVAVTAEEDTLLAVEAVPGPLGGDAGRATRGRPGQDHGLGAGGELRPAGLRGPRPPPGGESQGTRQSLPADDDGRAVGQEV